MVERAEGGSGSARHRGSEMSLCAAAEAFVTAAAKREKHEKSRVEATEWNLSLGFN